MLGLGEGSFKMRLWFFFFFPNCSLLYNTAILKWRSYHYKKFCLCPFTFRCYALSRYCYFWNHQHICRMKISCMFTWPSLQKLLSLMCTHACLCMSVPWYIRQKWLAVLEGYFFFLPFFPFSDSNLQCPVSSLCLSRWLQYGRKQMRLRNSKADLFAGGWVTKEMCWKNALLLCSFGVLYNL